MTLGTDGEVLDLLEALVRIDSVNPGLDSAGSAAGNAASGARSRKPARVPDRRGDRGIHQPRCTFTLERRTLPEESPRRCPTGPTPPSWPSGVSTVLYGPEGEGAHADVEWVSRNGTLIATGVLTTLARDFCR